MCGVQLNDGKRSTALMLMLGLMATVDQLAMANCICCYGLVLRREDSPVLRRALDFEVEGQKKKERLKRTRKKEAD